MQRNETATAPKLTKPIVNRIISIRHPGYDDENNVLLKLYACDHPEGGIHYETARVACGILAGNRWDGVLTPSSDFCGESVPSTGVLIGKDCYFHLPDWQPRGANDDAQIARRYPITCRLEEWTFPHGNLPQIWQDAGFAPLLYSVEDPMGFGWLASFAQIMDSHGSDLEAQLDSPKHQLRELMAEVKEEWRICQLCGQNDEQLSRCFLSGTSDYKWFMRNKMHRYLLESTAEGENDDKFLDPGQVKESMSDSLRNSIWLGENCQAERHNCKVIRALYMGQFSFAPKYEHQGKPIIVAVLFAPGDTTAAIEYRYEIGISNSRDNPFFNIKNVSIEMIFTRFALNVFWNLDSFLEAGVERKLNLMDHHGQISALDASPTLCLCLTIRMGALEELDAENSNRFIDPAWGVTCDGCGMQFSGLRYKCSKCADFDYCSFCIKTADSTHPDHGFVAIFQLPKPETQHDQAGEDQARVEDLPTDVTVENDQDRVAIDDSQAAQFHANNEDASVHVLQYETLPAKIKGEQAIRLFNLHPGLDSSPVSGDLMTTLLKESPTYEALSYAWGDPAIKTNITIAGGRLPVTLNLDSALRRLRRPTESRLLWIDALCINQGDDVEKSSQVQIMRDIYRQARSTLVWLGECDPETSNAIEMCKREVMLHGEDFLRHGMQTSYDQMGNEQVDLYSPDGLLPKDIEEVWGQALQGLNEPESGTETTLQDVIRQLPDPRLIKNLPQAVKRFQAESRHYPESKEEDEIMAQSSNPAQSSTIVSFYQIFNRAWFHRIWIIQEVSAAADVLVLCGDNEISWWIFLVGCRLIEQETSVGDGIDGLRSFVYLSFGRHIFDAELGNATEVVESTSLLRLLQMYRRFNATDARDKVYALLGLIESTKNIQSIVPNYQHDLTTVYTDVALTSIRQSRNLDVLGSVSASSALSALLPSWVSDWSDTRILPYPLTANWLSITMSHVFSASMDSQVSNSEIFDKGNLQLEGILFDVLTELGDVLSVEEPAIDITKIAGGIISSFDNMDLSRVRGTPTLLDLEATIRAGLSNGSQGLGTRLLEPIHAYEKTLEIFSQWDSLALRTITEPYITGEDALIAYYQTLTGDLSPPELDTIKTEFEEWQQSRLQGATLFSDMKRALEDMENNFENGIADMLRFSALMSRFQDLSKTIKTKIQRKMKYCRQRRLARTKSGYLSMVPPEAQVGDQVFILKGGKTPYIIRPEGASSRFVGECYVHGIMYGEAFDETKCRDVVLV